MSGVMPLVRGIDKDVREVKENLCAFKKEANSAIAGLRQDVSKLRAGMTEKGFLAQMAAPGAGA